MQKEQHKVTYRPNHELSRFSLICDKQTELSDNVLGGQCAKRPFLVAETKN